MLELFKTSAIRVCQPEPLSGSAWQDVLSRNAYTEARQEITQWNGYQPTPLHALPHLSSTLEVGSILYKDEGPRFGLGSFKALGAAYAAGRLIQRELLNQGIEAPLDEIRQGKYADQVRGITLISATDGNHGRSLAWGASMFGAPCRIYIHQEVSMRREQAIAKLGAMVTRIDGDYDDSVELARRDAENNGWFVVSDTSWPGYTQPPLDVMSGYGVMIDELSTQLKQPPTHLFVQGGVGGLAAGVAAASRQQWGDNAPKLVVVEPSLAACLYASASASQMTSVKIDQETLMAGLSCGEPSDLAWQVLREEGFLFLTIEDELVAPAMRLLARPEGNDPPIVAGESAIAGLAALVAVSLRDQLRETVGLDAKSRVLLIGSEGATDPDIYHELVSSRD